MGLFDRFKSKNSKESSEDYWDTHVTVMAFQTGNAIGTYVVPLDNEMATKFSDEAYLRNTLKNDSDIHSKTGALFYLCTFFNEMELPLGEYIPLLFSELNINSTESNKIIKDWNLFEQAVIRYKEKKNL